MEPEMIISGFRYDLDYNKKNVRLRSRTQSSFKISMSFSARSRNLVESSAEFYHVL